MQGKYESQQSQYINNINELVKHVTALVNPENDEDYRLAKEGLRKMGNDIKGKMPGFFTPYKNYKGFGRGLVTPIVAPLVVGLVAGVAAVVAALGAITTIGSLVVTCGSALISSFNKDAKEVLESAGTVAMFSAVITAAACLAKVAFLMLATVLFPLTLTLFITRSSATVVSLMTDYFSNCCDSDLEDKSFSGSFEMTNLMPS